MWPCGARAYLDEEIGVYVEFLHVDDDRKFSTPPGFFLKTTRGCRLQKNNYHNFGVPGKDQKFGQKALLRQSSPDGCVWPQIERFVILVVVIIAAAFICCCNYSLLLLLFTIIVCCCSCWLLQMVLLILFAVANIAATIVCCCKYRCCYCLLLQISLLLLFAG